ncbi:MAG: tetratricopeptide repeat-containing sensor histidine kinase [Reichenbachiella sp.]
MKTFYVFWLSICSVFPAISQSIVEVDLYNLKSQEQRDFNTDSVEFFADLALSTSREIDYHDGEIEALINVCFARYVKGNSELAIQFCDEAINKHKEYNSTKEISNAYLFKGLSKIVLGKFNEAIQSFLPLLEIASEKNNDFLLADACSNIGLSYVSFKNYKKALKYYHIALKIHQNIDHPHGLIYIHQNIGRIFFEQNQLDSANFYLEKTIETAKEINNQRGLYYGYLISGQLANKSYSFRKSNLINALALANDLHMEEEIGFIYFLLSGLHDEQNQADSTIHFATKAEGIELKYKHFERLQRLYFYLVKAYKKNGDIENQLIYSQKYETSLDSLNHRKSEYFTGIIDANEMMEDERSYELIKLELKAAESDLRQKNVMILSAVIGLILIAALLIVVFNANKQNTRSNKLLKSLNEKLDSTIKEKDLLLGIIVHDLRSPLSKIQGILEIFKGDKEINKGQREFVNMMSQIVIETNTLTDELLEINRLESGSVNKNDNIIEVKKFIDEIIFHQRKLAAKKEIEININYNLDAEEFVSDKFILQRIMDNLISNAIKFNHKNGKVEVQISLNKNLFSLSVKDDGPGIAKDEHKFLFKKFGKTSTKPTAKESSTGLGLYIVKNLIDNLNGNITFRSQIDEGTEFKVDIPYHSV